MESVPPINRLLKWLLTTEMASNYIQPRYITIVFMGVIMVYNGHLVESDSHEFSNISNAGCADVI